MTNKRSSESRLRRASIVVATLLVAVLLLFLWNREEGVPTARPGNPGTDGTSTASTERPRTPRERGIDEAPEPADLLPAVAVGEDGRLLIGSPPPYESADPETDYHYIVAVSDDGEEELGSVRTDHEGRFVLPEAARGKNVRLVALTESGAAARNHPLVVRWEDVAGTNVIFVEPRITGQVGVRCVDDTGVGVACKIRLQRQTGDEWRTIETLESGPDGRLGLAIPGAGSYRVRLMETANRSKRFVHPPERRFTVSDSSAVSLEFVVPRPAEIDVRVTDEHGRPLPRTAVGLLVLERAQLRPHPEGNRTDAEGYIRLGGIEPGTVVVRATHVGRVPVIREFEAHSGHQEHVINLRPGGVPVTGRILGMADAGVRIEHAGLHLIRVSDDPRENYVLLGAALAADGSFEVAGMPPGPWQLTLRSPDVPEVHVLFEVPKSDPLELGELDFTDVVAPGERSFELSVVADNGAREFAPKVLYRHETWPTSVWRSARLWMGQTDRVEGLRPGRYECRFTPQAHDPSAWDMTDTTEFEITPEGPAPKVTLRVRRR